MKRNTVSFLVLLIIIHAIIVLVEINTVSFGLREFYLGVVLLILSNKKSKNK